MFQSNKRLIVMVAFIGLSMLVVQNNGEDHNDTKDFDKKMDEIFGEDDIKHMIDDYLKRVPLSHKSRKHAHRISMLSKPLTGKHTDVDVNVSFQEGTRPCLKRVLGIIFMHGRGHIHPEGEKCHCEDCHNKNMTRTGCVECPRCQERTSCPPCKLPDWCRPPAPNTKCPPKPICPECKTITSTLKLPTLKPTPRVVTKGNKKVASSGCPTCKPCANAPKGIMQEVAALMIEEANANTMNQTIVDYRTTRKPSGKRVTTTSRKPVKVVTSRSQKGRDKLHLNNSTVSTSTKKPAPTRRMTTKKMTFKAITTKAMTTKAMTTKAMTTKAMTTKAMTTKAMTTKAMTTKAMTTKAATMKPKSTTTKKPTFVPKAIITYTSTGKPIDVSAGVNEGDMKITRRYTKVSKSNQTTVTTTTGTMVSVTETTTTIGTYLFERSVHKLIKNDTLRDEIRKLVSAIPTSSGGEEMRLAETILAKFGEKREYLHPSADKNNKTSSRHKAHRRFTFMNANADARGIIGFILDRAVRHSCNCPTCEIQKSCSKCPSMKPCPPTRTNCNCPVDPPCPAPPGCPVYPACKSCKLVADPNDDGDLKELDDVDPVDPLKDRELPPKCTKGFSCKYMSSCGKAPLNPLTPKKNITQAYMNGGEDQKYGEWPHFVRLDVNLKDGRDGLCGGVLISDRHVLTASHCVQTPKLPSGKGGEKFPASAITAVLADHSRKDKDEFEIMRNVSSVCYAKKFNDPKGEGSRYDYAILTLDKNVAFNDHIQPACLPFKRAPQTTGKGSQCYVIGLGVTKWRSPIDMDFASVVQKMRLEQTSCKVWGIKHDDRSRHCFTKYAARGDTCGGDSGGPVVCRRGDSWTVMGLVSYGSESCDGSETNGWVAVYTRIRALLANMQKDCGI